MTKTNGLNELLNQPTITVTEAAQVLGISRDAAFRAVHSGELQAFVIGRRVLVPTAPLRRLLGIEQEAGK